MERGNTEYIHHKYLEQLVYALPSMGEDLRKARWILKDGIWMVTGSLNHHKLCDLIVVYENRAVPIELKGSHRKKHQAIEQIVSGHKFITEELNLRSNYGIFVVYGKHGYTNEKIQLPR